MQSVFSVKFSEKICNRAKNKSRIVHLRFTLLFKLKIQAFWHYKQPLTNYSTITNLGLASFSENTGSSKLTGVVSISPGRTRSDIFWKFFWNRSGLM